MPHSYACPLNENWRTPGHRPTAAVKYEAGAAENGEVVPSTGEVRDIVLDQLVGAQCRCTHPHVRGTYAMAGCSSSIRMDPSVAPLPG